MSDIDDIPIEIGSGVAVAAALESEAAESGAQKTPSPTCLSCGAAMAGVFCAACGQKNDDMRRSSFMLARNFFEDTFGFDSRMWRTLGLLAMRPGTVPKDFAHGRRSRFTPPVRLFLVVSFLFFLVVALTNTLFVAIDVQFHDGGPVAQTNGAAVQVGGGEGDCGFSGKLIFFVKENALNVDAPRIEQCLRDAAGDIQKGASGAEDENGLATEAGDDAEKVVELSERLFGGINWAISNPRAFNSSFNDWLPRVMFMMAPVLAFMLALFLRGRDALIFDHLVLSLYTHAAGFTIIGVSLVIAQLGVPYIGLAAVLIVAVYYIAALKRAYGRGWIKTVWTALVTSFLYVVILLTVLMAIITNIIWAAA